jgi:hypothetical protein
VAPVTGGIMKKLKEIAYHEAGHAIMYLIVRKRFKKSTTIANEDSLARVESYAIDDSSQSFDPDKIIMIFLAGQIAGKKFLKKKRINYYGCGGMMLDMLLSHSGGTQELNNAYTNYIFELTRFYVDQYWIAVETLANELIEKREVGYYKAREIVFNSLKGHKSLIPKIFLGTSILNRQWSKGS